MSVVAAAPLPSVSSRTAIPLRPPGRLVGTRRRPNQRRDGPDPGRPGPRAAGHGKPSDAGGRHHRPAPQGPRSRTRSSTAARQSCATSRCTMEKPDVVLQPDSGKIGILAGSPPGGDRSKRTFTLHPPRNAAVDYWAGEDSYPQTPADPGSGPDAFGRSPYWPSPQRRWHAWNGSPPRT